MTDRPTVDFRPGAAVLVRVLDGAADDVATVVRQLGPAGEPAPPAGRSGVDPPSTSGEPDIAIRFVDRLPDTGPVRSIGLDDAAATDTEFLILRGRRKSRARVAIPLDRAGGPLEIVCERPVRAVPLLVPLVNMAALARGIVPVHASAVQLDGQGILIVGWSKGGKTETVLALMGNGAEFVGDEWIYLQPGGRATGLGEPCRIWDWQLAQLPWLADAVGPSSRAGLRLTSFLAGAVGVARKMPGMGATGLASVLDRAEPIVRRQLSVQVPPERLFGGRIRTETTIDTIVLASSVDTSEVTMSPIRSEEVIEGIVQSDLHERLDLIAAAAKFRFAFPDRTTLAIDRAPDVERSLLRAVLGERPAWRLDHPYPPAIERLGDVVLNALRSHHPGA
ncbi:MAG: hypothetical protein AABZ33_08820 [Chloroflexota bacterium]